MHKTSSNPWMIAYSPISASIAAISLMSCGGTEMLANCPKNLNPRKIEVKRQLRLFIKDEEKATPVLQTGVAFWFFPTVFFTNRPRPYTRGAKMREGPWRESFTVTATISLKFSCENMSSRLYPPCVSVMRSESFLALLRSMA